MKNYNIWDKLKYYFENNDGSLPEITISNIKEEDTFEIFEYLVLKAKKLQDEITVWDDEADSDIPCNSYDSVKTLFLKIKKNSSNIPLIGMRCKDILIPEFSCFVSNNDVELDYRMGPHWNKETIMAFIEMLKEVKSLAPNSIIKMANDGEVPFSKDDIEKFNKILFSILEL